MAYHFPPEWLRHRACWTAYPYSPALWMDDLVAAQAEFMAFCRALASSEPVHILVPNSVLAARLHEELGNLPIRTFVHPYGDIWLRDTGPLFLQDGVRTVAGCFQFNGWGNKYVLDGDAAVAETIAADAEVPSVRFPFVLEGGSVEVDGAGTCLTTRQCLLNPNRNPGLSQQAVEAALRDALGVSNVLWLENGLHNDHTDGHIDTLARFIGPGEVVCMEPGLKDPNARALTTIVEGLRAMRDARDEPLRVHTLMSPGIVENSAGELMPASYLNFYISEKIVLVPTYGTAYDAAAVAKLASLFPARRTVGLSARAILTGGGAFHCMTQQQPM